jgi:hypothetical protein
MSKDRNTMAKRQREMEKKRKADDKRSRRKNKDKSPSPIIVQDPHDEQASDEQPRAGE